MEASHLIAQMLSLVYVVVGIGILTNTNRYKALIAELQTSISLGYFGGIGALLTGFLIITFGPNTWEVSYEGLITLIGWLALLKGIILLIQPTFLTTNAQMWAKYPQLASGIVIILGLLLGYYGFA